MIKSRIFKQVPRLLFGAGSLERLPELLPEKEGADDYYIFVLDDVLRAYGIFDQLRSDPADMVEWFPASAKEPSTDQVDALRDKVLLARQGGMPKAVIGIGGGSTMDVAKAVSIMLTNEGSSSLYQGW